jgi:Ribbon-helix-helix protein, copG family.
VTTPETENMPFLAVRVDPELKRAVKAEAARRGMTLHEAISEALEAWLTADR